jgi:hypothetical protein
VPPAYVASPYVVDTGVEKGKTKYRRLSSAVGQFGCTVILNLLSERNITELCGEIQATTTWTRGAVHKTQKVQGIGIFTFASVSAPMTYSGVVTRVT